MEYIIIGDTQNFKGCLIYVCSTNRAHAEKVLDRMLNNPNEQDLKVLQTHTNIRISEAEDCWWNGKLD